MREISQGDCNRIADYMNNLPRRVLGYKTPADLFCSKVRRCRVRKVA
jgi:IS30 family transposase